MEQRLKNYLKFYGETAGGSRKIEGDKGEFLSQMLIQIGFFQHERLIHLIVTVLFAILAVISILASRPTTGVSEFPSGSGQASFRLPSSRAIFWGQSTGRQYGF